MRRLVGLFILIQMLAGAMPARAEGINPQPPIGFKLLNEDAGVWLYQKDYTYGTPDFVQVIHLGLGARIRLLHAPVSAERLGHGMYGGNDARLGLNSLEGFWNQTTELSPQAFCVTNGQFFYLPDAPTRLALPLKVDDLVITEGFGYDQYPEKLMFELWDDHADIKILTAETFYASDAPHILGGLPENANKRSPYAVGRTFIGVDDWDEDGSYEIVYVFTTLTASQDAAAHVLRNFGAEKIMMLDGGGSTQLICQGRSIIPSDRNIPQAIAVLASAYISDTQLEKPASQNNTMKFFDWSVLAKQTAPIDHHNNAVPIRDSYHLMGDSLVKQSNAEFDLSTQPELNTFQIPRSEIRGSDIFFIPLLMLPLFLVIFTFLIVKT